jgi:hypothetical protein
VSECESVYFHDLYCERECINQISYFLSLSLSLSLSQTDKQIAVLDGSDHRDHEQSRASPSAMTDIL